MRTIALSLLLVGCATTAAAPSASTAPRLVASSGGRSVWLSTDAPAAPPKKSEHPTIVVTTSVCTAGKTTARRCLTLTEQLVVDAAADEPTLRRLQSLTLEDVAVKLEQLIDPDGPDSGSSP